MAGRWVVRMVGPLASYAPGFDRELRSRGYTRLSAVWQLRLMAHVSRWLASEELDGAAFTPERVEEFCGVRRRAGLYGAGSARIGNSRLPRDCAIPTSAEHHVELT